MADSQNVMFDHKTVVEALIKHQGLHEGLWSLAIEFGLGAATAGGEPETLYPTAMVPVFRIGLNRAEKLNNLTVDAAKANPAKPSKKGSKKKSA